MSGRTVTIALCDRDGALLGALPPFDLETPWWMDTEPAVDAVRARWGLDVAMLRLAATDDRWPPHGGPVTYLAEVAARPEGVDLEPVTLATGDDPRRAPWAKPGGVAALIDWGDRALAARRRPRTGPVRQVRTWNLSCLLAFPTATGPVWLKAVPHFFAHEPRVLELLGRQRAAPVEVPRLVAAGDRVSLLDDIPGDDRYGAGPGEVAVMIEELVALQAHWAADISALLATGMPDRRLPALAPALVELLGRDDIRSALTHPERDEVDRVMAALPGWVGGVEECGLPDTLVHGDFHPGNWRGVLGERSVLLDWGDCRVGQPLVDIINLVDVMRRDHGDAAARDTRDVAFAAWRNALPSVRLTGDDLGVTRLAIIALLEQAFVFRMFLDNIEPSEHCYHCHDPEDWIRKALAAVRAAPL